MILHVSLQRKFSLQVDLVCRRSKVIRGNFVKGIINYSPWKFNRRLLSAATKIKGAAIGWPSKRVNGLAPSLGKLSFSILLSWATIISPIRLKSPSLPRKVSHRTKSKARAGSAVVSVGQWLWWGGGQIRPRGVQDWCLQYTRNPEILPGPICTEQHRLVLVIAPMGCNGLCQQSAHRDFGRGGLPLPHS